MDKLPGDVCPFHSTKRPFLSAHVTHTHTRRKNREPYSERFQSRVRDAALVSPCTKSNRHGTDANEINKLTPPRCNSARRPRFTLDGVPIVSAELDGINGQSKAHGRSFAGVSNNQNRREGSPSRRLRTIRSLISVRVIGSGRIHAPRRTTMAADSYFENDSTRPLLFGRL